MRSVRLILVSLSLASLLIPAYAAWARDIPSMCPMTRSMTSSAWKAGMFVAPESASAVMQSVFDDNAQAVRDGLAALPARSRAHWRQVALGMAVIADLPAMARALIAQGADPDTHILIPRYTRDGYRIVLDRMKHDPDYALAKSVEDRKRILPNNGLDLGPVLLHAISCDSTTMVRNLIDSGASVHARSLGQNKGADMLSVAVIEDNADATRLLLDHGAIPCPNHLRRNRQAPNNLAAIARKNHFPPDLVARLRCRAP